MGLTCRDAGVDIDAGDALVERIRPFAKRTRIPETLSDVGGFAGLCAAPQGVEDPILVSGTDGVGAKLQVAFLANRHDTIGEGLVAMCVNDVVTAGARPLFFLDYFGTGRLSVDTAADIIRGIAHGRELADCALLGGETAELPGCYADGEYDLAGSSVGVLSRSKLLDGKNVRAGDVVLAGFMRVLAKTTVDAYARRIVNVHPSLLPALPGARGPRDALRAGARIASGRAPHGLHRASPAAACARGHRERRARDHAGPRPLDKHDRRRPILQRLRGLTV